jgi:hypothetical protein
VQKPDVWLLYEYISGNVLSAFGKCAREFQFRVRFLRVRVLGAHYVASGKLDIGQMQLLLAPRRLDVVLARSWSSRSLALDGGKFQN